MLSPEQQAPPERGATERGLSSRATGRMVENGGCRRHRRVHPLHHLGTRGSPVPAKVGETVGSGPLFSSARTSELAAGSVAVRFDRRLRMNACSSVPSDSQSQSQSQAEPSQALHWRAAQAIQRYRTAQRFKRMISAVCIGSQLRSHRKCNTLGTIGRLCARKARAHLAVRLLKQLIGEKHFRTKESVEFRLPRQAGSLSKPGPRVEFWASVDCRVLLEKFRVWRAVRRGRLI